MGFFVRDCVRCGVKGSQHFQVGESLDSSKDLWEIAARCSVCSLISIYEVDVRGTGNKPSAYGDRLPDRYIGRTAVRIATTALELSEHIPERVAGLFSEANECRQMTWYEAAGAMYRKTLDVATKHIYTHDPRLAERQPAQALRVRIKSLGEMNVLDKDIVELADVAALDGNDATHDVDPYTKEEAEALEDLTFDLLDRLFVRPAKIAAVKAKQIAAGVRQA